MNFNSQPLVSIIIPTYNRAHLIGETLDSILGQVYLNWECIVVDDGSNDGTHKILEDYNHKDSRIKYHHRPLEHLSGGNGARNYGLALAQGDYVIFFDSDDLMTIDHVNVKVEAISTNQVDYVITKTKFFNSEKSLESYYSFGKYDVLIENYLYEKINWLTCDTLIKSNIAKSISFNEKLRSGQEYNFHCKLIIKSNNYHFINKFVTHRRKHNSSIRARLKTKEHNLEDAFYKKFYTYKDIRTFLNKKDSNKIFFVCLDRANESSNLLKKKLSSLSFYGFKEYGWVGVLIPLMYFSKLFFKSNYKIREFIKKKYVAN